MSEETTLKVPTPIIQIMITLILAAVSSYVGVLSGTAVTKSQMLGFDKRLSAVEAWKDEINDQQVAMYKSQIGILERELDRQKSTGTK